MSEPTANRPRPEDFLELVQKGKRGRLKLYIGFAAGVGKTHMIDGRLRHSLLLEIFTDTGIGTEIHR